MNTKRFLITKKENNDIQKSLQDLKEGKFFDMKTQKDIEEFIKCI